MRATPSVLHVDLDAFFAAVEQRDKPSLRGRPVVVGGTGGRGVVATASYEARAYGVRSAMPTVEARARCPHAAYLAPRFAAYEASSAAVMAVLSAASPLVEPLGLDEAYVDLAASAVPPAHAADVAVVAAGLRAAITERTGLTASVGAATTPLLAKIASDAAKPDGLLVVAQGTELALLHPLPVRTLPGVGPATADRLDRLGVRTVGALAGVPEPELVALVGRAHGSALARLARGEDDRVVHADRATKSVSVEDTFEHDVHDPGMLLVVAERMAARVCRRLVRHGLSGRTVTVKVRLADFTTFTRSRTLPEPTDDQRLVAAVARTLLAEAGPLGGVRLLGVGVAGLGDWVQTDLPLLPAATDDPGDRTVLTGSAGSGTADGSARPAGEPGARTPAHDPSVTERGRRPEQGRVPAGARGSGGWVTGQDVRHDVHGRGWVWGCGHGLVTVRFEHRSSGPGPVRSLASVDAALHPADPEPLPPSRHHGGPPG